MKAVEEVKHISITRQEEILLMPGIKNAKGLNQIISV